MNVKRELNDMLAATSTNIEELTSLAIKGAAVIGGAAVAYEVFKHRRLLSVVGAAAGAGVLAQRWLNGKTGCRTARTRMAKDNGSASFPGEAVSNATQEPSDPIDEAMMESFPASDPPASYRRA